MHRIFWTGLIAGVVSTQVLANGLDDLKQGEAALGQHDRAKAIAMFNRAIAAHDLPAQLRPRAFLDRGVAYARNRQVPLAMSDFGEALKLKPDFALALSFRAQLYDANGDDRAAAADCRRLGDLKPPGHAIPGLCGYIEWKLGQFQQAIPYFEDAVHRAAGRVPGLDVIWLEVARLRAGKPDQSEFSRLTADLKLNGWPAPVFDLYLGKTSPQAVEAAAARYEPPGTQPGHMSAAVIAAATNRQLCMAAFFVGEWQILHGNRSAATTALTKATTVCPKGTVSSDAAAVELKRMAGNQN